MSNTLRDRLLTDAGRSWSVDAHDQASPLPRPLPTPRPNAATGEPEPAERTRRCSLWEWAAAAYLWTRRRSTVIDANTDGRW